MKKYLYVIALCLPVSLCAGRKQERQKGNKILGIGLLCCTAGTAFEMVKTIGDYQNNAVRGSFAIPRTTLIFLSKLGLFYLLGKETLRQLNLSH